MNEEAGEAGEMSDGLENMGGGPLGDVSETTKEPIPGNIYSNTEREAKSDAATDDDESDTQNQPTAPLGEPSSKDAYGSDLVNGTDSSGVGEEPPSGRASCNSSVAAVQLEGQAGSLSSKSEENFFAPSKYVGLYIPIGIVGKAFFKIKKIFFI